MNCLGQSTTGSPVEARLYEIIEGDSHSLGVAVTQQSTPAAEGGCSGACGLAASFEGAKVKMSVSQNTIGSGSISLLLSQDLLVANAVGQAVVTADLGTFLPTGLGTISVEATLNCVATDKVSDLRDLLNASARN